MEWYEHILVVYFLIISLIGAVVVPIDKWASKRKKRRVPEKTFFILSLLGASAAIYLSMGLFNHKTQKNAFVFLIPLIFFAQCAFAYYVLDFNFFG